MRLIGQQPTKGGFYNEKNYLYTGCHDGRGLHFCIPGFGRSYCRASGAAGGGEAEMHGGGEVFQDGAP